MCSWEIPVTSKRKEMQTDTKRAKALGLLQVTQALHHQEHQRCNSSLTALSVTKPKEVGGKTGNPLSLGMNSSRLRRGDCEMGAATCAGRAERTVQGEILQMESEQKKNQTNKPTLNLKR